MKKMFSRKKSVLKKEEQKRKKKTLKQKQNPKVFIAPPEPRQSAGDPSRMSSSVEPVVFEEAHRTQFLPMPRPEVMQRISIQTPKIDYGAEEKKQAKQNAELFSMKNMKTGQRRYYGGAKPSSVGVENISLGFKD